MLKSPKKGPIYYINDIYSFDWLFINEQIVYFLDLYSCSTLTETVYEKMYMYTIRIEQFALEVLDLIRSSNHWSSK